MTNEELIKELEKLPKVKRQMTAEYGTIEVEKVRFEKGCIIID